MVLVQISWATAICWAVEVLKSGRIGRSGRPNEGDAVGDTVVSAGTADKPKVSLGAASEGGGHGFSIGFDFLFKFGETLVGRIAAYLCQRGVLEVSLPVVVGLGVRHGV